MNRSIAKTLHSALILAAACCSSVISTATASVTFPSASELSSGRWIKINFSTTGIYEITYDELREMGFADPSKVAVFGRGGQLQPMQFSTTDGSPAYSSTLAPVAMLRCEDKIIFFGQGREVIRQIQANHKRPNAQQFELVSDNTFATTASYILTDTREGYTPETALLSMDLSKPVFTEAWQINYHHEDLNSQINSGREFFGEKFGTEPLDFSFSFPNAKGGEAVSTTMRALHNGSATTIDAILNSGDNETTGKLNLRSRVTGDYYAVPSSPWFTTTLPGAEGKMSFTYNNTGSWAYLDYFIMAAKTRLGFAPGAPSFMAYVSEFSSSEFSYMSVANIPSDLVVWDVATPQDVYSLPWNRAGDNASVRYLRDSKQQGLLVGFSPSATHPHIDSWSEVSCSNLHSIGVDSPIPSLLIITLPDFLPAAERIAALHKEKEGIDTRIVLSDDVITEFSGGVADPMAYRALAKMIYDRDDPQNRKFKNLLLLGPCVRDNRGVNIVAPFGTLICNESLLAQNVDDSFTLNDWYGMLEDHTEFTPDANANLFCRVPMQIGVGNIPCRDLIDANYYVEKLEAFYNDNSFAYWLNEANYVADSADNNEHQNLTDALHSNAMQISSRTFAGAKLYNNLYEYRGTTSAFCRNLAKGSLLNYYLGHSDPSGLSGEFWMMKDETLLKNTRLAFMTFASCTVTEFDCNSRGSGENLVFLPSYGLIGGLMTTRSGYSFSNYVLADLFQRALMLDSTTDDNDLLSTPRTVGEAYAMAKSAYTQNPNKLAYVLVCDPALTLPMPTAAVAASLDGDLTSEAVEVYPHQEISLDGSIQDRDGNLLSGFNGTLVVKVYNAPVSRPTRPRKGADVINVEIDETPVAVSSLDVKDGNFSGKLLLPSSLAPCDGKMAIIRFSAYDATNRTAAASARRLNVQPYDADKAVKTDLAPEILNMYAGTPDYSEGQVVASSFTLGAEMRDDHGIMLYEVGSLPSVTLVIDGFRTITNLSQYATLHDEGRCATLLYPVKDLAPGVHTFQLNVADAQGQTASRILTVNVGEQNLSGTLTTSDDPARTSATFRFIPSEESASEQINCTLVILDASGCEIYNAPMAGFNHDWMLTDKTGERVAPGVYTAICRLSSAPTGQGATKPVRVTVF